MHYLRAYHVERNTSSPATVYFYLCVSHSIVLLCLLRIEATCLSVVARSAKSKPCTFDQKWRKFCIVVVLIDLENVDPRSRALHHQEFLCEHTHHPSFVFLARLGAEIAGDIIYAPLQLRNFQPLSSARERN